ncbi:hypothetical protein DUNSADRAFT_4180 [Dunaliella salina]|uniref:Encoded protein n=1 Tax=Dunaliella salina TaxID=3046 RepID=A0ABQ7FUX7_DUNSA|nr:hypothetical protein DUNSADRAFT_4180 [Dunaliella salina]|eukprot:KAF5826201.1 hypothetical protein DUNSADRAFT_4180 [Dunaliella salina]
MCSVSCLAGSKCPQTRGEQRVHSVNPFIRPSGLPQGGQQ